MLNGRVKDFQFDYSGNNQHGAATAWSFNKMDSKCECKAACCRKKVPVTDEGYSCVALLIKLITLRVKALTAEMYHQPVQRYNISSSIR